MAELNRIQKFFSEEVSRQINQFAIDIVDSLLKEVDQEIDNQRPALGLTQEQQSAFQALMEQAQHTVLSRYGLEVASVEQGKKRMKK